MSDRLALRLVSDELWEIVKPLLPSFAVRPRDGGTAPADERAVFTAVVYVLTSGCAWRHLPPSFGVSAVQRQRDEAGEDKQLLRRPHLPGARATEPQMADLEEKADHRTGPPRERPTARCTATPRWRPNAQQLPNPNGKLSPITNTMIKVTPRTAELPAPSPPRPPGALTEHFHARGA
nr:transposase [Frankia sp. Cj3]